MSSDRTASGGNPSGQSRRFEPVRVVEFERQMKLAREIMERWKDVLRALAR